jgi:hypothetical protein
VDRLLRREFLPSQGFPTFSQNFHQGQAGLLPVLLSAKFRFRLTLWDLFHTSARRLVFGSNGS